MAWTLGLREPVKATADPIADVSEAARSPFDPQIVNGVDTFEYPSVGALLLINGQGNGLDLVCTATLIGCQTVLTAAHCLCGIGVNGVDCVRSGIAEALRQRLLFGLQHAGGFSVASVSVNPEYEFGVGGDVAVLRLDRPVAGILPSKLNSSAMPASGSPGLIVGFGETFGGSLDGGVKRSGGVVTTGCSGFVPDSTHVCWVFDGQLGPPGLDSNTCHGDSGGPLFVGTGQDLSIAGITSGGLPGNCLPNAISWDTDVFRYRSWIQSAAGTDLNANLCGVAGTRGQWFGWSGVLGPVHTFDTYHFEIPPGTRQLRLALNGQVTALALVPNDFDLFVRANSPPAGSDYDCASTVVGPFEYCDFDNPRPGTWYATAAWYQGAGVYQLTATLFSSVPSPTRTPSLSPTRTMSRTSSPVQPTPTFTRSRTPTPSSTRTHTPGPTATIYVTFSSTPSSTRTHSPTRIPTLSESQPGIELSSPIGAPGQAVVIEARLRTGGAAIGAAQADIAFDGVNTPIRAMPNGAPDCTRDPNLNKQFVATFRPIGCAGSSCNMLRTFVFANAFPISPVTDGTLLYTCKVDIQLSAPAGVYQMTLSGVALSDPSGGIVPAVVDGGGIVTVHSLPTPSARQTPLIPSSSTPTQPAIPSLTAIQESCGGDCNGDLEVTVDELLTMVSIALGIQPIDTCAAGDISGEGEMTVDEILVAVNNALLGCPRSHH
jgi:hypothetical protein